MLEFILHALPAQGRRQVPDTDHVLAQINASQLLLINLVPGEYAFEVHPRAEYLLCLTGTLVLEDEHGRQAAAREGEMVEIPPGLRHRFAPTADAVIVTVAQGG
ncbi:MAG: cupin domain-containing protein [Paludibacterium sp.]|uniref:cupin domain-containing protein n=1 Tax=Paludibacterium sp. TaxID=1917523 RepID=UPI0025F5FF7F|nr:cupin domain-containing protein [Paludibacterium sp.]MBV8047165.1 cupin domain-containing protein [Paludibacterium sp.]MBV8649760.1 cupin domain-containing protein [Paludibacterium sp.]